MREHLELFFRGERDYLQGSLILSQAVAASSRTLGLDEARPVAVVQASFRSITARHWARLLLTAAMVSLAAH